jgi:hypothetical protein
MKTPSQLISWHCTTCGKLGSVFVPLPCYSLNANRAVREDHDRRSEFCSGVARLQSAVTEMTKRAGPAKRKDQP